MQIKDIFHAQPNSSRPHEYLLSILQLCPESTSSSTQSNQQELKSSASIIEHIVLRQAADGDDDRDNLSPTLEKQKRYIDCGVALTIPALAYNLGLSMCRGKWVWLWNKDDRYSVPELEEIFSVLEHYAPKNHIIGIQPTENHGGKLTITIDNIFNGLCPVPSNLIWSSDIFERFGAFDPHLAVRDTFASEMLLRVIQHVQFSQVTTQHGIQPVGMPKRMRDTMLYADSQTNFPTLESLSEYSFDDLTAVARKHGNEIAWQMYLDYILPYYYQHRHSLPRGTFISPQSSPRELTRVLFTKVQYETSNELTFGNYERHFHGTRFFLFSYLQSELLRQENTSFELNNAGQIDVLVSTRTADEANAVLLSQANAAGCASAYMLDDDLLKFYEYGNQFASFCPGDAHYEAMHRTIKEADVVIGYSKQIGHSVSTINRRYVQCDGSVPHDLLPTNADKPQSSMFRFGYAGGGYRTAEFEMLRPAIERIITEYGDHVSFSFWGMPQKDININVANIEFKPFSQHYIEYLERLRDANFDAMLVPLMSEPAPKKAKAPNKFTEAAIANAIGLYSDVPSYQVVKHGITGFKVAENSEAWYQAMKILIEMPAEQRAKIRGNALAYVRTFFSTPALATTTETGIIAAQLHRQTRAKRLEDGRPLVAFFFPSVAGTGGGEIQLWRRLELARQLGLQVLVVISSLWASKQDVERTGQFLNARGIEYEYIPYNAFFTTPYNLDILPTKSELDALREFFLRRGRQISLVHSLAFVPAVGQTCAEFGIPHLASIYGIDDAYEFPNGALPFKYCDLIQSDSIRYAKKWAKMLKCEWVCARENVPAEIYDIGFEKLYVNPTTLGKRIHVSMLGTFTQRKSQFETIQSLAFLPKELLERIELHLYGGIDTYPAYGKACRQARREVEALGAQVEFHGHIADVAQVYRHSDIVLSVSTLESFPSTIKEATAAGTLVIASTAGGISEMMVEGVNCFLTENVEPASIAATIVRAISSSPDTWLTIRRNAYALAVEEFHPRRTLHDLALCYNLCIDLAQSQHPESVSTHAPIVTATSPVELGRGLTYQVIPAYRNWLGLDVRVERLNDTVDAVMLRVKLPDGRILRETAVDVTKLANPRWLEFRFHPIVNSAYTSFIISFTPANETTQTSLLFYEQERTVLYCDLRYGN